MGEANAIGVCWYPFKEIAGDYCECCGKKLNPHTEPTYGTFYLAFS